MIYLQLFFSFLQIGMSSFGGGYAAMPLIREQVVSRHGWLDMGEFTNLITISQMTPGPIAINSATFIGYRTCGVLGSVAATLGVVLPSFVIILVIAFFLRRIMEYRVVQYAFFGIRAGVLALIVKAVISFWKRAGHNVFSWLVMIAAFVWAAILEWSVIALLALCALAGFVFCFVQRKRGKLQ